MFSCLSLWKVDLVELRDLNTMLSVTSWPIVPFVSPREWVGSHHSPPPPQDAPRMMDARERFPGPLFTITIINTLSLHYCVVVDAFVLRKKLNLLMFVGYYIGYNITAAYNIRHGKYVWLWLFLMISGNINRLNKSSSKQIKKFCFCFNKVNLDILEDYPVIHFYEFNTI